MNEYLPSKNSTAYTTNTNLTNILLLYNCFLKNNNFTFLKHF